MHYELIRDLCLTFIWSETFFRDLKHTLKPCDSVKKQSALIDLHLQGIGEEKSSKRIRLKKIEIQKPKWDEGVSVRGGGCRSQVSGRPGETEDCRPSFEAGSQWRCDKQTNQTIVSSLVKTHDNRCRTNRGNCESSLGAWSARGSHIVGGIFTTFLFLSWPPGSSCQTSVQICWAVFFFK